jgi:hypothetical protein
MEQIKHIETQNLYIFFFIAILLIVISSFIPPNQGFSLSIISILIIIYVIYLNIQKTIALHRTNLDVLSHETKQQVVTNIVYSYFFTFSLGLLLFFVVGNQGSLTNPPLM